MDQNYENLREQQREAEHHHFTPPHPPPPHYQQHQHPSPPQQQQYAPPASSPLSLPFGHQYHHAMSPFPLISSSSSSSLRNHHHPYQQQQQHHHHSYHHHHHHRLGHHNHHRQYPSPSPPFNPSPSTGPSSPPPPPSSSSPSPSPSAGGGAAQRGQSTPPFLLQQQQQQQYAPSPQPQFPSQPTSVPSSPSPLVPSLTPMIKFASSSSMPPSPSHYLHPPVPSSSSGSVPQIYQQQYADPRAEETSQSVFHHLQSYIHPNTLSGWGDDSGGGNGGDGGSALTRSALDSSFAYQQQQQHRQQQHRQQQQHYAQQNDTRLSPAAEESADGQQKEKSSETSSDYANATDSPSAEDMRKFRNAACSNCHRMHKKCDGKYPNPCSRCVKRGVTCTYIAPKKRGPKKKNKSDTAGGSSRRKINKQSVGGGTNSMVMSATAAITRTEQQQKQKQQQQQQQRRKRKSFMEDELPNMFHTFTVGKPTPTTSNVSNNSDSEALVSPPLAPSSFSSDGKVDGMIPQAESRAMAELYSLHMDPQFFVGLGQIKRLLDPTFPEGQRRDFVKGIRRQLVDVYCQSCPTLKFITRERLEDALQTVEDQEAHLLQSHKISIPEFDSYLFLLDAVMAHACQRLNNRHYAVEFFEKAKLKANNLMKIVSWENCAAMALLSLLAFTEKKGNLSNVYSKMALNMAEELSTKQYNILYYAMEALSMKNRIYKTAVTLHHFTLDSHLVSDPSTDKGQKKLYDMVVGAISHDDTVSEMQEWFAQYDDQVAQKYLRPEYEDIVMSTGLAAFMVSITLARHEPPAKRTEIFDDILRKLRIGEEFVTSASCPRSEDHRLHNLFAIYTIRADIHFRLGEEDTSSEWAKRATDLAKTTAFLKSPPDVVLYLPVLLSVHMKLQNTLGLEETIEPVRAMSRKFHILQTTNKDITNRLSGLSSSSSSTSTSSTLRT